ncbi:hypothetical protein LAZ40_09490 [Cereibacter sphaeroides]|uniref:hypothetical protein n=1 Tax=Cereibacter sphaeroides TaxID=1063 RepID=UPI001F1E5C71|nr:hypothetical protein [Cereibacter sphaeroides]MCE6959285.1 hypothetical protein [Cereibacter sphaeroides]MCE6972877.1 hypothetical protein [Cereibacter sphaeroides]
MATPKIDLNALVNANSSLIADNAGLRAENARLQAENADLRARLAVLDRTKQVSKESRTSLTGRVRPRSELDLHHGACFEIAVSDKHALRVIAREASIAEELRSADPAQVIIVNCAVRHFGLEALSIGFIEAELIFDRLDKVKRPAKGEAPVADGDRTVKAYALTDKNKMVKIVALGDDGILAHRPGDRMTLSGAFRSIRIGEKYYDFFFTESVLREELDRRNGITRVEGSEYQAPSEEDARTIPF